MGQSHWSQKLVPMQTNKHWNATATRLCAYWDMLTDDQRWFGGRDSTKAFRVIHPACSHKEAAFRQLTLIPQRFGNPHGMCQRRAPHTAASSPFVIQQLLPLGDVTLITHGQELQHHLCILLISFANGSLICLELNDVDCFVRCS